MQFVYFIPDFPRAVITPAELDAIGLGHMHGGRQPMATRDLRFAENAAGLFVSASESVVPPGTAADLRYAPDQQTWRAGPMKEGKPLYHVGFGTDRRPTAESLVREKPIGGTPVTLLDGEAWQIPVAMARLGMISLPLVMDLNDVGQWVGRVSPQYLYLCEHAKAAYDSLLAVYLGTNRTVRFDESMRTVTAALSANYRVGPVEIALLGLIGDDAIGDVLEAVCDWSGFREVVDTRLGELRGAGPSSTGSGATDESPATSSPGLMSASTL